jgi:hypothetical protein
MALIFAEWRRQEQAQIFTAGQEFTSWQPCRQGRPSAGIHTKNCGHSADTAKSRDSRTQDLTFYVYMIVGIFGTPGWIRTIDHPIKSRMLYH